MRAVHRRTRALIEERGLRYDKVAARLGYTRDRFAHILDGRRPVPHPPETFYAALAAVLRCDVADVAEEPIAA